MKIFTTMGYIEFFYKKFPGKSNDFQGGFASQNGGGTLCCLEAPRGGYMLPQANIAGGKNLRFSGVIFMESAFAEIVKKSVGAWGRGPGGRGQGARGMGAGGMGAGGDFSRGGVSMGGNRTSRGGCLKDNTSIV